MGIITAFYFQMQANDPLLAVLTGRDAVAETVIGCKPAEHKPIIYSLPKNSGVEPQQKLESIIDVGKLQVRRLKCQPKPPLNCLFSANTPDRQLLFSTNKTPSELPVLHEDS